MKSLTVQVDEDLLRSVKLRALESDITVSEVVRRLLGAYASTGEIANKYAIRKKEATQ